MSDLTYTSYIYVAGFSDPTAIAKYKGTPAASKPKDLEPDHRRPDGQRRGLREQGPELPGDQGCRQPRARRLRLRRSEPDQLQQLDERRWSVALRSAEQQRHRLRVQLPHGERAEPEHEGHQEPVRARRRSRVPDPRGGLRPRLPGQRRTGQSRCVSRSTAWRRSRPFRLRRSTAWRTRTRTLPAPRSATSSRRTTTTTGSWMRRPTRWKPNITGDINDVAEVEFQYWNGTAWAALGTDVSAPFTWDWTTAGPMTNDPPAAQDTVYFRTIATDLFGNVEPQSLCDSLFVSPGVLDATCYELQLIIVDCTPPMACLCQIGSDYDPSDGAFVPLESAVDISACFTDGDGDADHQRRGARRVRVPPGGHVDLAPAGLHHRRARGYERRRHSRRPRRSDRHQAPDHRVGSRTEWVATVTWDTRGFVAGSYDLRAIAYDIEGNGMPDMTCTATATLDDTGLRAYIQPCVNVPGNVDSLFANVYIHDVAVNKVEFQYTADANSDGLPDGGPWITIGVDGLVPDKRGYKGDVILRAGTAAERVVKNSPARVSRHDHRREVVPVLGHRRRRLQPRRPDRVRREQQRHLPAGHRRDHRRHPVRDESRYGADELRRRRVHRRREQQHRVRPRRTGSSRTTRPTVRTTISTCGP